MSEFKFSPSKHIERLEGYMDAVGRSLTTDEKFFGLSVKPIEPQCALNEVLSVKVFESNKVENWSLEFGSMVDVLLNSNQNSRLMFYLIDYVCWFEEFTDNAICFKIECEPLYSDILEQAVYHIKLQDSFDALITIYVSDKKRNDHHPNAQDRIPKEMYYGA